MCLKDVVLHPYASVICFPKPEKCELQSRLAELRTLGVDALEFFGNTKVHGVSVPVLGKGFVGLVVVAYLGRQKVALKIRRTDADRVDLFQEAKMLSKANSVGVGPKFLEVSRNFLLMQLIDGEGLFDWLVPFRERGIVQGILRGVLEQCFRLDQIGLDHGELSKAPKHVMIDTHFVPWIVDFESASDIRRPSNVTALSNFLFAGGGEVSRGIALVLGDLKRQNLLEALRRYRNCRDRDSFEGVLEVCFDSF